MTLWMLLSCLYLFVSEDVEVTEFICLGSDRHVSVCCEPEVNKCLGSAWGVMDSLDHGVWCCRYRHAGGQKSEFSGPWCFHSCPTDVRLEL